MPQTPGSKQALGLATVDSRAPSHTTETNRPTRYYLLLLGAILLAYAATFLIVRPWAQIPFDDDWVYARDCLRSAQANWPVLTGYESAWSIPQLLYGTALVKLAGFSYLALRATSLAAMAGSLMIFDLYLRSIGTRLFVRLIAVFSLAFHPFAYPQAISFMTDIPFLFAWTASCYSWDRALDLQSTRWLISATSMTMVAVAQRQFGLFVPMSAFLFVSVEIRCSPRQAMSLLRKPAHSFHARFILCQIILAAFACAIFSIWRLVVHGYSPVMFAPRPLRISLGLTFVTASSLALSAIPLLLATRPTTHRMGRAARMAWTGCAVVFAALAVRFLATGIAPLFHNVISTFGFFPEDVVLPGRRPTVIGPTLGRMVSVAGTLAILYAMRRVIPLFFPATQSPDHGIDHDQNRPRGSHSPIGFGRVLILSSVLYLCFVVYRGVPMFDRYLLPALPAFFLAIAKASPLVDSAARRSAAVVVVVFFAGISTTLTYDYDRWHETAWHAAQSLVQKGVPADAINAGYEWNGWVVGKAPFPSEDPHHYAYVISHSELPEYECLEAIPWTSIWGPHRRDIFILRRKQLCPSP